MRVKIDKYYSREEMNKYRKCKCSVTEYLHDDVSFIIL